MISTLNPTRARARFNRLRHMTFEECAWRAGVVAHRTADRLRVRLRHPHWNRADIEQALAAHVLDPEMRMAIARREWTTVHDNLARRLRREDGRCALAPSALKAV